MSSRSTSRACIAALALAVSAAGCDSNSAPPPASAPQQAAPQPAAQPQSLPPATPAATTSQDTAAASPASVAADSRQWETRAPDLSDADIPPLPVTPFAAARPMEIVRSVYTFAAKHPEVLSHVPCFCGCENRGHKHNDDCFVAERDAKGRPTKWEPHGVG